MADALVLDMPMELGLELVPIIGSNLANAKPRIGFANSNEWNVRRQLNCDFVQPDRTEALA